MRPVYEGLTLSHPSSSNQVLLASIIITIVRKAVWISRALTSVFAWFQVKSKLTGIPSTLFVRIRPVYSQRQGWCLFKTSARLLTKKNGARRDKRSTGHYLGALCFKT